MGNKLLTQFILLLTSLIIVVTYIRPAFAEIADIQDDIVRYESTVSKASELNAALNELVQDEKSISSRELANLNAYLPTAIAEVVVMRDIQNMFEQNGLSLSALTSASPENYRVRNARTEAQSPIEAAEAAPDLVFRDFQISFFGTYEQLKSVLSSIEVNAYPLEIMSLEFGAAADVEDEETAELPPGVMQYNLTLRAYALGDK